MKAKNIFRLMICLMLTCTVKADWLLDTNTWDALTPFCDSQMTLTNGSAFFLNRGILVSQSNFPTSIEIRGSFEFVGNTDDQFEVNLRTDGTLVNPAKNFPLGAYVHFGGGDIALNAPNNVGIHDDIAGTSAPTNFTFAPNTFYNFRIIDDGTSITLYLDNLTTPFVTLSTTNRQGSATNRIDMENSRGSCGGSQVTDGAGIVLKSFTVREFVNLNIYTAIELGFINQSNEIYQLQASPDLNTWTNFDAQIQGTGSNWFKTYSIRGQPRLFYRIQVVQ